MATDTISKDTVISLIEGKSCRITLRSKENSKSEVWKKFKIVAVDSKPQPYVCCDNCGDVLTYRSGSTTSLARHICQEPKSSGVQLTLDKFTSKPVPQSAISNLNKQLTLGLAGDLRPLSSVERRGFKTCAQALIDFGATYGFKKANDVLQTKCTMKSHLSELVDQEKSKVKEELNGVPSKPKFAFTTDMWDDKTQNRNFLSVSIHYMDIDFRLSSKLLGVEEFPNKSKTTENIREECKSILRQYFEEEVDNVMTNSYAVTDGGSNFINIFAQRLPCMCHRLNTVITWIFNEKVPKSTLPENISEKRRFLFSEQCPRFAETLSSVKEIVTYFKKAKIKLSSTVKQEVVTRWNSKLTMLESVVKAHDEIKKALFERAQYSKIESIDLETITELVQFLKPFRECTEAWSKDKSPTIHEVVLWINDLKENIATKEGDSEDLKNLKQQAMRCFEEYLKVEDLYYIACVLRPKVKKLKFLTEDERDRIYNKLRTMIDSTPHMLLGNNELCRDNDGQPTVKKSRFADYEDSSGSEEEDVQEHELDRYLKFHLPKGFDPDVLTFWKETSDFPRMRCIAQWLLAIPASQTTDERVFSTTGGILTPRRTELGGGTLSDLTYVHKNYDYKF